MHSSFMYVMIIACLISIYIQSSISFRIDQTIGLINEQMIQSCISQESLIEFYDKGINQIEIDKELLNDKVENTLTSNLPFLEHNVGYYYYNSSNINGCGIGEYTCNCVQIKIEFTYKKQIATRIIRYELTEKA